VRQKSESQNSVKNPFSENPCRRYAHRAKSKKYRFPASSKSIELRFEGAKFTKRNRIRRRRVLRRRVGVGYSFLGLGGGRGAQPGTPPPHIGTPPSVNFCFHPPIISRTAIDRVMMGLYAAAALFVKNDAAFMEDEKRSPAFAKMGRGNNGRR